MARQRCLNRDHRRLRVAYLADEDDIGVLAQDRAKCCWKRQPRLFVDLHLHNSLQAVLHRVLDGHDVHAARLHRSQHGIERRRLARTRGTRHEDDSLSRLQQHVNALELVRVHSERVDREHGRPLVENANDDLFAVRRRQRGHAKIHTVATANRDAGAPVLRTHAIGDVQLGHDLHARNQRNAGGPRQDHHLPEHAVNAIAHRDARFLRLQVDVRGARLDRFRDNAIHQLDDRPLRGLVGAEFEIGLLDRLGNRLQIGAAREALEDVLDHVVRTVHLVEPLLDLRGCAEGHAHRAPKGKRESALAVQVVRVARRDVDDGVGDREREHAVLPHQLLRHQLTRLRRHEAHVGNLHPESLRKRRQDQVIRRKGASRRDLPVALRALGSQLRHLLGRDQRFERRQQPLIPHGSSRRCHFPS